MIDDGSTDNSFSVCQSYAEKNSRFKVIRQKNAGQGAARNKGIKEANGDYVVFCDSDDFYERNALAIFANTAEKEKMPDLVIAGSQKFYFDRNGEIVRGTPCFFPSCTEDKRENILRLYMMLRKKGRITAPWAKAYRRKVICEHNLAFPDLRRCEDVIFNLSFYDHINKICIIKNIQIAIATCNYSQRINNLTI